MPSIQAAAASKQNKRELAEQLYIQQAFEVVGAETPVGKDTLQKQARRAARTACNLGRSDRWTLSLETKQVGGEPAYRPIEKADAKNGGD